MNSRKLFSHHYSVVLISIIAALAGILFGYDTGVISGAILFIAHHFVLTHVSNGLVVSAVLFGAFVGAIVSGQITDHFGRKSVLVSVALIFIVGTLETAFASNVSTLVIGRIIVGIAIGIASYAAPLYISEIAPVEHRGALVSLNQLAIGVGILISYIVDYIFAKNIGENTAWRWMLGFGVLPAFLLFFGMLFLPNSPRWLMIKGRTIQASNILKKLRGEGPHIDVEMMAIEKTVKLEKMKWKTLFSKNIRSVIIIGIGLAVLQQVTGINTILYYAPTILTMTGFDNNANAILASLGVGTVFVLFTIISLPLIDKLGRRKLLLAGLIGMTVSLLVMAYGFQMGDHAPVAKMLTFSGLVVYIASFAFSLGPIVWLMIAEIYPLRVRGFGASMATCFNWLSNMFVTFTFLSIVDKIGISHTFIIYFIMCLLALFFVYFLVPETKGVSLEKIEQNLIEGKRWRKMGAS